MWQVVSAITLLQSDCDLQAAAVAPAPQRQANHVVVETRRLPKRLRLIILDAHEVVDHASAAPP
jgi:hypothetical protein